MADSLNGSPPSGIPPLFMSVASAFAPPRLQPGSRLVRRTEAAGLRTPHADSRPRHGNLKHGDMSALSCPSNNAKRGPMQGPDDSLAARRTRTTWQLPASYFGRERFRRRVVPVGFSGLSICRSVVLSSHSRSSNAISALPKSGCGFGAPHNSPVRRSFPNPFADTASTMIG